MRRRSEVGGRSSSCGLRPHAAHALEASGLTLVAEGLSAERREALAKSLLEVRLDAGAGLDYVVALSRDTTSQQLKASYTSTLRPHTLVP